MELVWRLEAALWLCLCSCTLGACSIFPDECKEGRTRVKGDQRQICARPTSEASAKWSDLSKEQLPIALRDLYVREFEKKTFYLNRQDGVIYQSILTEVDGKLVVSDFSASVRPDSSHELLGSYLIFTKVLAKLSDVDLQLRFTPDKALSLIGRITIGSESFQIEEHSIRPMDVSECVATWQGLTGIPGLENATISDNAE